MSRLPRSRAVAALVPAMVFVLLGAAPAAAGAPTERLRGFFTQVNAVLADSSTEQQPLERVTRIRRLVKDIVDFPSAAAAALGPEWMARTAAEREEFVDLFAELLERAYVGRLAGAVRSTGGLAMTYRDEVVDADTATVSTALRALGGKDGHVEYRMTMRGGRWQVRDIVLDGVSVVDNYRAQFTRLLQRDSYAAVVTAMRAKLADDSLMFAAMPRRVPGSESTARAERETPVALLPPAPEKTPPPSPPPPSVTPAAPRRVVQHSQPVATLPSRSAPRIVTPVAVAAAAVAVVPPAPAPSTPAASAATPFGIVLGSLFFVFAAAGSAAYLRRR